jgi:hypothetical protein
MLACLKVKRDWRDTVGVLHSEQHRLAGKRPFANGGTVPSR